MHPQAFAAVHKEPAGSLSLDTSHISSFVELYFCRCTRRTKSTNLWSEQ